MRLTLNSPRTQLGRFLEGVDDPGARVVRGGRLAALGFITGGLTAIPVNLILTGLSPWEHLLSVVVLGFGFSFLMIRWEDQRPRALYLVALLGILIITTATVYSTLAFAINFVFVSLFVALVAPLRLYLAAMGLITVALLVPAVLGPNAGSGALAFAVVVAPTLLVTSVLAYQLVRMLELSRQDFWDLSRQDGLTGVGNYRALIERLEEEIARHTRHGGSLALAVLDLDEFKQVNDLYGHMHGDQVLRQVGGAIHDSVRAEDSVFRQGGDEFAILAPQTEGSELDPVLERLRARVAISAPGDVRLTIGAGVATFPADGTTADDLLGLADVRLMGGKRTGARGQAGGAEAIEDIEGVESATSAERP